MWALLDHFHFHYENGENALKMVENGLNMFESGLKMVYK